MDEKEKMKRILIFSHAMKLGGAERALLGLLENVDFDECEVDLFLMRQEGELLPYLSPQVRLLPEVTQYTCLAVPIIDVIRKGKLGVALGRVVGKFLAKRRVKKLNLSGENSVALEYSHKYTNLFMPWISRGEYDLAISFLTPHYFVANKVKAKKKIAWIHTDYFKVEVDVASELKMWSQYDYIASISDDVTKSFLSVFPSLKSKIKVIKNVMATKCIEKQAEEFSVNNEMVEDGSIKLLSIGRFCKAKNFDNVPDICKKIVDYGLHVKWYLIGFGGDEELIQSKINESQMQEHVIILGKRANPYPYIKACDIYVQPSRYEGDSVTVHEAQFLNKPVVITKYATSASQLEDGVDGIIVPMDNEGCAEGIVALLNDPEKMKRLSANCKLRDYSNKKEINKIYRLMDGR